MLDAKIPGANRLFVMGFDNNVEDPDNDGNVEDDVNNVKRDTHRKYFLPRVDIKDYNVLTDGRNFYDQNISKDFKKYEELRKVMTGRGTDSLYIQKWKSIGSDDESKLIAEKNTSNNTPKIVISNEIIGITFSDGDYFKQEKVDYIRSKVINIYIVYKLTPRIITEDGIVQVNGLFGNLKIGNTKNTLHYRYYDGI